MEQKHIKKPYSKPQLKVVRIRPREVLGSGCHNSMNQGPYVCDLDQNCAY